jgi:N-acetylmuramic acid 6-phosphate etherase
LRSERTSVLSLLNVAPSSQSIDFVRNKKQFQLHQLLTEQRHPRTWNLSASIKKDIKSGLDQIMSVDEDISQAFNHLARDPSGLDQAAEAVSQAIRERRKIFIYGCGSTGRLAKQMESALWRPFWSQIKESLFWTKLKTSLPEDIEDRLTGEMTGGDRALISALEGFEDLDLVGMLQLLDRGIKKGDVVFGITEGGETSSVIGAVRAALEQHGELTREVIKKARNQVYFLYNNPDDRLECFDRCRSVIENPAITKINLTTGPQALAGSTRMQAATSETFIMGLILEEGIGRILKNYLSREELSSLGSTGRSRFEERLSSFPSLINILRDHVKIISKFTALEAETYQNNRRTTYFAKKALITVFIDCAERSPTFHLYPLDTVQESERKSWIQVWTEGKDSKDAWNRFLGRSFRGLEDSFYEPHFKGRIDDAYLKQAALKSLSLAGQHQGELYDFSFSEENISRRGPKKGDLGVAVCVGDEIAELGRSESPFCRFIRLFKDRGARVALVLVGKNRRQNIEHIVSLLPIDKEEDVILPLFINQRDDPLSLNSQVILKILLNAHSTAVMARLGKIVGNTMTNVKPSNLKLIGRATHLILSHVNDVLSQEKWIKKYGKVSNINYSEANAVLFEAIDYISEQKGQISEVALSIMRILESLKEKRIVTWNEAQSIAEAYELESYLVRLNPSLR